MDFLFGAGVGFVIGWILFKRPDWASAAVAWIKSKIGLGS